MAHQDSVSIGVSAHRPRGARGATGSSDVLDDYRLAERARHVLADDAGGYVGPSTRGKRHDHRNRARRIRLPACDWRYHRQRNNARGQMQKWSAGNFHRALPASRAIIPFRHHSGLMFAARITLAHFSVSSAISLPKSAGEPGSIVPPRSASRAFTVGSVRPAFISLLSFPTISGGVFLGAPTPNQVLVS